jgi:hypothetical protein
MPVGVHRIWLEIWPGRRMHSACGHEHRRGASTGAVQPESSRRDGLLRHPRGRRRDCRCRGTGHLDTIPALPVSRPPSRYQSVECSTASTPHRLLASVVHGPSTALGGRYVSRANVACNARTAGPRAPRCSSLGGGAVGAAVAALAVAIADAGSTSAATASSPPRSMIRRLRLTTRNQLI